MDGSDIGERTKARQRALRIALGLFFFAAGAYMAAAVIIGFDAAHTSWQDYMVFILPAPWLVCAGVIFAYRPAEKRPSDVGSRANQSRPSLFPAAIGTAVFGGVLGLLWALDWREVMHELIVTAGAVLLLLFLAYISKESGKKRSADADRANQ